MLKLDEQTFSKNLRKAKKIFNWEKEEAKLWKIYELLK